MRVIEINLLDLLAQDSRFCFAPVPRTALNAEVPILVTKAEVLLTLP